MTKSVPGIKIPYFRADQYPVVEGLRCVEVLIPDTVENMALLAGLLKLPGRAFNWQGDDEKRYALAQSWRNAYEATDWEGCMTCDDVADCIENDADVQAAINNVYNSQSTNTGIPASLRAGNLLPPNPGCDPDKLWGSIENLIEEMDANNRDAQQVFEEVTDAGERVALLFESIPILETLPIDELITYTNNLWTDDIFEAYEANDTTGYREELKCDIFCIARGNGCYLSLDDLMNYFGGRVGSSPEDTLSEVIGYLVAGTWTGTEINDLFYFVQTFFMKEGNKFFDLIGLKKFEIYLATGTPSDDWILLCEECTTDWCHTWDFTLDDGGWQVYSGFGTYIPGVGWTCPGQTVLWLYREDFGGNQIKTIQMIAEDVPPSLQAGVPYDTLAAFDSEFNGTLDVTLDVTLNPGFNSVGSMAVRASIDGIQNYDGIITSIQVCGFGEEPDWDA